MTLKTNILAGNSVACLFLALVVVWAVSNLVSLGRATDGILNENYRSILAAETMVDALERQDSAILLVLLGDVQGGDAQFREQEAVFLEWLVRAKDNITIAGEGDLVAGIDADFAAFRTRFARLTDQINTTSPLPVYNETVRPLFEKIRAACLELRRLNEATMYAASLRAGRVASRAIWSTVLVALVALGAALACSLVLAERITRPVRRVVDAARTIAAGNYDVQVPVEGSDELGVLAGEFNRMSSQLHHFHEMNIDNIISEKNKSEAILSSIEDGLVVLAPDLTTVSVNPAARRMLGVRHAEVAGLPCRDILPDAHVLDAVAQAVQTGSPADLPEEQRVLTIHEAGQARHYLFSVAIVRGLNRGQHRERTRDRSPEQERAVAGMLLLLRDVTRMKELERLKSEFVMAASHELRTPLTSLGMSVELLQEHVAASLAPQDRELLQAAHEEVRRMKALVHELLDLSKLEAGRIELELERVPVATLFEHVQTLFKSQADMKGVTLEGASLTDVPDVRADANKTAWVLSNLVSNALRYADKGGRIRLDAHRSGAFAHLVVQDDGPGIAPEYHGKIFEKFVQIKGRESGGSGLGLAICKEIVRAHGGTIWVESAPGHGSTFTFTLPLAV